MQQSMVGVFAYLTARSLRNRFAGMVKQVRSPRYALALVFGVAYIWFFLFNRTGPAFSGDSGLFASEEIELLATLGLFVLFMRWWLFGNDRSALAFSPAEVQFFFPAPVTRRALIQYKLLRAQLPIIFNAALWVLFFGRGGADLPSALRAVSIWALFTIFMLHRLGATIVRAAAAQHGRAGAKRNVIALTLFGVAAAGLLWTGIQAYPVMRQASGFREIAESLKTVLQQPIPHALLAPFRLLLAPTFADNPGEWTRAFIPVLVIAALHYLWVVRTELGFEDAAVEASAQRARLIEELRARRSGGGVKPMRAGKPAWLPLASTGHPAVAILWKNMVALTRSSGRAAIGMAVWIAFMTLVISMMGGAAVATVAGSLAFVLAMMSILIGARFVRLDLRQDLVHLRVLRTYPLEGSALVAAEVAGSTLILTAAQMGFLIFAHIMFLNQPDLEVGISERWALLAVAPLVLLILNAASVTIQNAAALLFPAWVKIGTAKAGGVEVLGQSILTTLMSLLMLALALLPPGIAAVAAFAGIRFLFDGTLVAAAVTASVIGLATLAFEVGMAMTMLGELFERGEMVGTGSA